MLRMFTLIGAIVVGSGIAHAAVDANGPWFVTFRLESSPLFSCNLDVTQSGTELTMNGPSCGLFSPFSATGTIDPATGIFSASASTFFGSMFDLNGAVALDGQSFFANNDCGFPGLHCDMLGSRCGNGIIDVGETCDDGAQNDGDCCSSACQLELPGSRCDTGNPCSESICDGSGSCLPVPIAGACDDGNSCTTDDTCVDARCQGTTLADGSSCDDGNACQQGEVCQGGSCMPGPEPTRCGACETCDFFDGCIVAPDYACTYGSGSSVHLRQGLAESGNALSWRWSPDYALPPDPFGDPPHDTSYELCVFEERESPEGDFSWGVVAKGTVEAGDRWSGSAAGGYRYHATDGVVRSARLRNADPGHVAIGLRARGRDLGLVSLPGDGPVAVQLRGSNAGCWLAEFWGPFQRTGHTWTARID